MRFSWFLLGLLALSGSVACSSTEPATTTGDGSGGHPESLFITLTPGGTVDLAPGEIKTFTAAIDPPAARDVAFTLVGDAADASVAMTLLTTGEDGVATTDLHAPTAEATFELRASIVEKTGATTVSAAASISVSDVGFATVRVRPEYFGLRPVTTWTASAAARTTCAALVADKPNDPPGGLLVTADAGDKILIHDVPVGPSVAVTLRAGHYAWGCVDVAGLVPDTTVDATVTVADQPIALAQTDLIFKLGFTPDPASMPTFIDAVGETVGPTLFGGDGDDAAYLLDAMGVLATGDYASARDAGWWDEVTSTYLSGKSVDLHALVTAWANDGMGHLDHTLRVHVTSDAALAAANKASLAIVTLGSLEPQDLGLPASASVTWTSQTMDRVQLGGIVPFRPSALFATAASIGAPLAVPGATSVADALSTSVDCEGLGQTLGGYGNCGATCMANLCKNALKASWAECATISSFPDGQFLLTITGYAQVDDEAAPASVTGQWVGSLTDLVSTGAVSGTATAFHPTVVTPADDHIAY